MPLPRTPEGRPATDGSEQSFREAGRQIPFVRLEQAHDAKRRP
ncbi:hypothetical protein ACFV9W_04315 [Streptomyces sp. NPDC059897]